MRIKRCKTSGIIPSEVHGHAAIEAKLPDTWFGYASLEFIVPGRTGHEIDLVVVTHERILLVDLKNWRGIVTTYKDQWLQNGRPRGRSPIIKLREAAREVKTRLEQRLGNRRELAPYVDYAVVFTAECDLSALSKEEKHYATTLDRFVALADVKVYAEVYPHRAKGPPLSHLRRELDTFFCGNDFKAQERIFSNYKAHGKAIFEHPRHLFREYRAEDVSDPNWTALLRLWDLDRLPAELSTDEERTRLATREKRAIGFLRSRLAPEAADGLALTLRVADDAQPVSTNYFELYDLRRTQQRLDEFLARTRGRLSAEQRLRLISVLLGKFAAIHEAGLAHRDLGEHCVWVEEPHLVVLSGFATASFPDAQTIAEHRQLLAAGGASLPEDILASGSGDPFRGDVFAMAETLARLAYEEPLPRSGGIAELPEVAPVIGEQYRAWLARALDLDPAQRPADARELLRAFEELQRAPEPSIDFEIVARHASMCIPYVNYPPSGGLRHGRSIQYRSEASGGVFVKVWNGVTPASAEKNGLVLATFLHAASELQRRPIDGIAPILDFGLGPSGLFLVTAFVSAEPFGEGHAVLADADKTIAALRQLARAVGALHDRGLSHGDLKPEHVLIYESDEGLAVRLVDVIDYSPAGEARNSAYAPPRRTVMAAQHRDCYAVAKLAVEAIDRLLAKERLDGLHAVREAIATHLADDAPALVSTSEILRLLSTNTPLFAPTWTLDVANSNLTEHEFTTDGGKVTVLFTKDKRTETGIVADIFGLEEKIRAILHPGEDVLRHVVLYDIHSDHVRRDALKRGAVTLDLPRLRIRSKLVPGATPEFVAFLQEKGRQALATPAPVAAESDTQVQEARESEPSPAAPAPEPTLTEHASITTPASGTAPPPEIPLPPVERIWAGLVEAEAQLLPSVSVTGGAIPKDGFFLVPVTHGPRPLEFTKDEEVTAFLRLGEGDDRQIGRLDLENSIAGTLAIRSRKALRLSPGQTLVFRATLDDASFRRRSQAVERVITRRGEVPEILDFFDPKRAQKPTTYNVHIDDEALAPYGLNSVQRDAFQRVIGYGPLSLLQGPPGTGKTRFIGALVHFLLSRGHAENVLFVGQSHVAVNSGAEKILDFLGDGDFRALTRIGQYTALSDRLKPYHPDTLRLAYRELFRANLKGRLRQMSRALAVPSDFVEAIADIHLDLEPLVRRVEAAEPEDVHSATELLYRIAIAKHDAPSDLDPGSIMAWAVTKTAEKHRVRSPAAVARTEELVRLAKDWVGCLTTTTSFDEFLARTRRVVCGTCVGVGRSRLGIATAPYDWVIVDEAARCAPGELAVPLQVGRRVLLVGDHRQLPPMYDDAVLDAAALTLGVRKEHLVTSDFERTFTSVYGRAVGTTLIAQYRMAEPIGSLVSEVFYPDTPLQTARAPVDPFHRSLPSGLGAAVVWLDTSNLDGAREMRKETRFANGKETSFLNEGEVDAIVELLKAFERAPGYLENLQRKASPDGKPIGIICMYAAQRDALLRRLSKALISPRTRQAIKVDTVDAYQGHENVVVIVSLVRNNPREQQGFLEQPERVNVAFSRAQDKLVVVGAARMWSGNASTTPLGRVLERLKRANRSDEVRLVDAKELFQ
ncbi:AAA domain-containing protein [Sorangium sp. So ce1024]|uniref:AAA domain-containing protein n=1 Tax=Sorangium sp. So ce1024 TaxID=3133327 RepID=UPI003EFE916F